jgi:hypothetical protein
MLQSQRQIREIYHYICHYWLGWFHDLPSYQAFNPRLNNFSAAFCLIFIRLLENKLLASNCDIVEDSIIDSFPVMLSKGRKAKKCRTAQEIADFGYCSSKDIYYHGVKLHNLARPRLKTLPLPVQVFLSSASNHDRLQRTKSNSFNIESVCR